MMKPIAFKRHRFPLDTIRPAVWLYFRITSSLRDVGKKLAEPGIDTSYETVRCWANKFGPAIAAKYPEGPFKAGIGVPGFVRKWRTGWDSNPRWACTHGGFQDRCLKPLGHLSLPFPLMRNLFPVIPCCTARAR